MEAPSGSSIKRGRVFSILFSAAKEGEDREMLRILTPADMSTSTFRQISVVEEREAWSPIDIQNSILEGAALALRKVIVNTHNKNNPLRIWESACWCYRWIVDDSKTANCVILALIPTIAEGIVLQRPEQFRWTVPPPMIRELILKRTSLGQLTTANDLSIEDIYRIAGRDLIEQDPSPNRPALKKGRSVREGDLPTVGDYSGELNDPDGIPQDQKSVYVAE